MKKEQKVTALGGISEQTNVSSKMDELIQLRSQPQYKKWWWDSRLYDNIFKDMAEVKRKCGEYQQKELSHEQLDIMRSLAKVKSSCIIYLWKRPGTRSSDVGKERQQLVNTIFEECQELQIQLIKQLNSENQVTSPQDLSTEPSDTVKTEDDELLRIENEVSDPTKKADSDKKAPETTNTTTLEMPNKGLPKERLIKKDVLARPEIENHYTKTFTKMVGTRADTMGAKGIGNIGTAYTTDDILSGDPREKVFNESVYKAHILMLSAVARARQEHNSYIESNSYRLKDINSLQKAREAVLTSRLYCNEKFKQMVSDEKNLSEMKKLYTQKQSLKQEGKKTAEIDKEIVAKWASLYVQSLGLLGIPEDKFENLKPYIDGQTKKKRNIISYEAEDIGKPKSPKGIAAPSERFSAWLQHKQDTAHPENLSAIIGNQKAVQAYPKKAILQEYLKGRGLENETVTYHKTQHYEDQMSEILKDNPELEMLGQQKIEEYCTTYLKELLKNGAFRMRMPQDKLYYLFRSTRFLTLHEIGISSGFAVPKERANFSSYAYGIDPEESSAAQGTVTTNTDKKKPKTDQEIQQIIKTNPKSKYEKYGYLWPINIEEERYYKNVEGYGDVIVTFKKSAVEKRCTVTLGDSFNNVDECIPTPVTDPKLYSVKEASKNKFIENAVAYCTKHSGKAEFSFGLLYELSLGYIELQYHGDLTIDDIESITFAKKPSINKLDELIKFDYVINMCKEYGIPVKYLEQRSGISELNRIDYNGNPSLWWVLIAEGGTTDEQRKSLDSLIRQDIKENDDLKEVAEKWKDIL